MIAKNATYQYIISDGPNRSFWYIYTNMGLHSHSNISLKNKESKVNTQRATFYHVNWIGRLEEICRFYQILSSLYKLQILYQRTLG
jgi:hypothetical protein